MHVESTNDRAVVCDNVIISAIDWVAILQKYVMKYIKAEHQEIPKNRWGDESNDFTWTFVHRV